ncbi:MAG TPA: hypothetical protein VL738_07430 [Dactylosporangium sp.]|nr:hypothetical protein [Dactylosporangium sp.]
MDFDDRRASELLMPLRQAPTGPSTVDVGRAIARGERRRATIRAASAAAVVLVVLAGGWAFAGADRGHRPDPVPAVSASPSPEGGQGITRCTASEVETPPAAAQGGTTVMGGDPSGRYLVGLGIDGAKGLALLWDRGKYRIIDLPDESPTLLDINSAGVAVGYTTRQRRVPWVVVDGRAHELARAGGDNDDAVAYGINAAGQIAGTVKGRPVLWPGPDGQAAPLPLPGPGYSGWARAVDDDGTVVGQLFHDDGSAAWAWAPDGTPTMLAAPVIDGKPATEYGAFDVRNGWVAGTAGTTGVLWNLRTGKVRVVAWGMLMAVNGRGWTVLANEPRAAVDTGTQRVDLPSVPGAEGGVYALAPAVLSDDGRFAAGTAITSANGHRAGTRWTCR